MSKHINRQSIIITALFLGMIIASFFFAPPEAEIPYDLDSNGPLGLAALQLWLEEMGYDSAQTGQDQFNLTVGSDPADLLFVFPNLQTYSDDEGAKVRAWVENGGTLVLAGATSREVALVDEFGVSLSEGIIFPARNNAQVQPLLPEADANYERVSSSDYLKISDAAGAVPIFAFSDETPAEESAAEEATSESPDEPITSDAQESKAQESTETNEREGITVAVQTIGDGVVWHISPRYEPINILLREPEVGLLVIAFLRTVPEGGKVLFDTYHLFGAERSADTEITSINEWLYRSAMGRALIFATLLTLLYLFVQGRRLGPPLPATTEPKRREAAEYVDAMAGLHRRSKQRQAVAIHHKQRLKIALGKPLHIDPELDDAAFIERLRQADHRLSPDELSENIRLIQALAGNPTEDALVDLVAGVDGVIGKGYMGNE